MFQFPAFLSFFKKIEFLAPAWKFELIRMIWLQKQLCFWEMLKNELMLIWILIIEWSTILQLYAIIADSNIGMWQNIWHS